LEPDGAKHRQPGSDVAGFCAGVPAWAVEGGAVAEAERSPGWLDRNAAGVFAALGGATLLAYVLLWLRPLWLAKFEPFDGPALYVGTILGYDGSGFLQFVLASLVPSLLYLAALLLLPRVPLARAMPVIIGVTVLAPVLLLTAYPALAADVFGYLMYGRIVSEYGGNPYIDTAAAFPSDAYVRPVGGDWKDYPAPYGPLWVWVPAVVTWLAGDQPLVALLSIKMIVVAAHLGVALLVWMLTHEISGSERKAAWALLAYGWSPLAITHFALDAHNDAPMLFFLLLALWFMRRQRPDLAFPALTLSILVKFVPLLLAPLFLLGARRQPLRAAIGFAASMLLVMVAYAPLWDGRDTLDAIREQSELMTSSPLSLLHFYVNDDLIRPLSLVVFGLGYLLVLWRWRSLEARSYAVVVLYYVALSSWTKGWYFTWALALGAILGGPAFVAAALAGFGVFLQNMTAWGWEMNTFGWTGRYGVVFWEWWLTWTLYLPWLLVAAWVVIRRVARPAG
jgi:alpha-1,6-mannosyltransferase